MNFRIGKIIMRSGEKEDDLLRAHFLCSFRPISSSRVYEFVHKLKGGVWKCIETSCCYCNLFMSSSQVVLLSSSRRGRMCPLWPIHYVFMYLMMLGPIWLFSFRMVGAAAQAASKSPGYLNVNYSHPGLSQPIVVDNVETIEVTFNDVNLQPGEKLWVHFEVDDEYIAEVSSPSIVELTDKSMVTSFNVTGKFLGYAKVCPEISYFSVETKENVTASGDCLNLAVARKTRPIDKAFTYSVAGLVTIIYVNMGAALDVTTVRNTLKRPVGPLIGFMSQFVIMPVVAYGLAKWLIEKPSLQLGLFITGCSPGGGASNIWTLTLGGNLDLSITMTTVSTFAAFAMMPLWILTLGSTIFHDAKLGIPYRSIANFAVALVVPLAIGIIIRRFSVKFANLLVKILKPFAVFLIVFIVVFAIFTNLYLFQLFTLEILACGFLLPLLGYILGGGFAAAMRQDWKDVIAIAVETGVQNTGLAIFALRISLDKPEDDLTTALPVAVAMMTPILPTLLVLIQKVRGKKLSNGEIERRDPLFINPEEIEAKKCEHEDQCNGNGDTLLRY